MAKDYMEYFKLLLLLNVEGGASNDAPSLFPPGVELLLPDKDAVLASNHGPVRHRLYSLLVPYAKRRAKCLRKMTNVTFNLWLIN